MELPLSDQNYYRIREQYKKTKNKQDANRLNIILLKHKQYAQVEIADILNMDENTISTWIRKFQSVETIEEYLTLKYTQYLGKLTYTSLGKIDAWVGDKTLSDTKPIVAHVKEQFGVEYSNSGINKLLHRLGFSYKSSVAIPSKLDIDKQADFVKKYEDIESKLTDKSAIFFMDAVHPQHNTHTLKGWLRKGVSNYILTNSGRNRLNINGLYNPHNQDAIVTYHDTINAQATIELLNKLKIRYPSYESLYVFCDNARYYVSKVLKAYLAENPQIILIHLPAYSPNLNLIERLWKYLRKEVINGCYYEQFCSFKAAIVSFFDKIDQHQEALSKFIGQKFRYFDLTQNTKTNFA